MTVWAIVPARGGSKGIPGKNLAAVAGRPLLVHTLRHALAAPSVDRIVVSTDDDDIAAVARREGAEVVERPAGLSGDEAGSEAALLHALDTLRAAGEDDPDLVVFLQATSPIRSEGAVEAAIRHLLETGADSLFSASPQHGFLWRRSEGSWSSLSYDFRQRPRRQDAPEDGVENGSIYVFKPAILRDTGNRLGGRIEAFAMSFAESLQIDEPLDLEVAERLLAGRFAAPAPDLSRIGLLVLDFDGVMTDNRVVVDENGKESVVCSRGDGYGVELARKAGLEIVVISKESNPVAGRRCRKLGIACHQGVEKKLELLQALASERGVGSDQIVFVGNDLNDLEAMGWAGIGIAVADAEAEVLQAADWITSRPGGRGAVREVTDLWRHAQEAKIDRGTP